MGYKTVKSGAGFNVVRTTDKSSMTKLREMTDIFTEQELNKLEQGTVIAYIDHKDDAFGVIEMDKENIRCLTNEF